MKKINNYIHDNNIYKELERKQLEIDLPISNPSGQDYLGLLKINEAYNQQLTKLFSENFRYKNNASLPFNDMVVINSLLKENLNYLHILLQYQSLQYEFDDLYNKSIQILNLLEKSGDKKIKIFQKCFRLKFMKLKFQLLRIEGRDYDLAVSDNLLDEFEKIYKDPDMKSYISEFDIASFKLDRAFIKFCLCDFYLAKEYALNSFEILNKYDFVKLDKNENKEKFIKKQAHLYEFLAQLYDMDKDYQNCLNFYEKCYYLYLGIYSLNHPIFAEIRAKIESYKNAIKSMNSELKIMEEENLFIQKFNEGIISKLKGTTDSFSFVIPVTKMVEPLLISIYALPEFKYMNLDYFSKDLFLKNLYLDKMKLLEYLGYDINNQNENYIFYTDDALNFILQKMFLIHNKYIYFTDPTLYSISINC